MVRRRRVLQPRSGFGEEFRGGPCSTNFRPHIFSMALAIRLAVAVRVDARDVENNSMWPASRNPQGVVAGGRMPSPIPIDRANMGHSVRRASRASMKARCMPRALETRKAGRIAGSEWEHVPFPDNLPIPYSSFLLVFGLPLRARRLLRRDARLRARLSRRSSFSDLMSADRARSARIKVFRVGTDTS